MTRKKPGKITRSKANGAPQIEITKELYDSPYFERLREVVERRYQVHLDEYEQLDLDEGPDLSGWHFDSKKATEWLRWKNFQTNAQRSKLNLITDMAKILSKHWTTPATSEGPTDEELTEWEETLSRSKRNTESYNKSKTGFDNFSTMVNKNRTKNKSKFEQAKEDLRAKCRD